MKMITFICCMILTFGAFAQKGAFGEELKTDEQKIEEKVVKVTGEKAQTNEPNTTAKSGERLAPAKGKAMPVPMVTKTYSVLLFHSENPIDVTDKALKTYGDKLFYRQVPNGEYYYMVGEFNTVEAAKEYLKTVQLDFPKAELVNDIDQPHIKL